MSLFQRGDFTLASGAKSEWKIECDGLDAEDWETLALMLNEKISLPFGEVHGVPSGGVPLAEAMQQYVTPGVPAFLVVDDVWTTGGSMQKFIDANIDTFGGHVTIRAVVFARNPVPDPVVALFVPGPGI